MMYFRAAQRTSDGVQPQTQWVVRMLLAWMALHVLDALLTAYLFGQGGVEGNPFLRALQGQVGGELMLIAKVVAAAGIGFVIWRAGRMRMMPLANVLMALIVVYNSTLAVTTLA